MQSVESIGFLPLKLARLFLHTVIWKLKVSFSFKGKVWMSYGESRKRENWSWECFWDEENKLAYKIIFKKNNALLSTYFRFCDTLLNVLWGERLNCEQILELYSSVDVNGVGSKWEFGGNKIFLQQRSSGDWGWISWSASVNLRSVLHALCFMPNAWTYFNVAG